MKILCPFDFSKSSLNSLTFIIHNLTKDDHVDVFHAIDIMYGPPPAPVYILSKEEKSVLIDNIRTHVNEICAHNHKDPMQIKIIIDDCPIASGILDRTEKHHYDLVAMGTHDKETLFDRIIGSHSNYVATLSKIPVLLVHSNSSTHHPIKKILFAMDADTSIKQSIKQFIQLEKMWGAKTDYLYLNESNKSNEENIDHILNEYFIETNEKASFEIREVFTVDAKAELGRIIHDEEYDLLTLVKDNSSIFETYFKPSFSINAVHKTEIPALILKTKI